MLRDDHFAERERLWFFRVLKYCTFAEYEVFDATRIEVLGVRMSLACTTTYPGHEPDMMDSLRVKLVALSRLPRG